MKKVLFISTIRSMFYNPIRRAFEKCGYEVHFVDYRGHYFLESGNIAHRILHRLPKKIGSYLHNYGNEYIDRLILKTTNEIKPDFVFVSKAKYISTETLDKLRMIAPTANWYPEGTNNIASINRLVGHYDYFFEFDKSIVDVLKKEGHKNVYYLPFCGDMDKNDQWQDTTGELGVVFVGSYSPELYPQRLAILEQIKDLGLNVWGNEAWSDTSIKSMFHGRCESTTEVLKGIYSRAKIVIHMDALTTHSGTGMTMRPFDVASAGSMLIAQDDRKEIFDFFQDGKEMVSFRDEKDIRSKVQYYLTHEEERKKIAKAGFIRTRNENTYLDRVKKIVDTISGEHKTQ